MVAWESRDSQSGSIGTEGDVLKARFALPDSDQNLIPDSTEPDNNHNGVPDNCETVPCRADIAPPPNGNGLVNVDDLLAIINSWGRCPPPPALCRAEVDELALEFAMPQAGSVDVLAGLPAGMRLGLGCVDVRTADRETPEAIVARVRQALRYVPAERLSLNPDCGFAPSGNNPIPLDEAYLKLKALGEAARMLREEFRKP